MSRQQGDSKMTMIEVMRDCDLLSLI